MANRWIVTPCVTVVLASFIVYMALSLAPGDPVAALLGPHPTPAEVSAKRQELGLDQPILERYLHWLAGAVHGNFGLSLTYQIPVSGLLSARLTTSLLLVAFASVLVIGTGLLLGILGALVKPAGPSVAALSGLGLAVPSYVAASVLVALFSLHLRWFPALGAGTGLTDRLWHLTLPAIALAFSWSAYVTQITRTAVREESRREHVDTARGRGIAVSSVVRRHVLRNASVPIITASGLTIAGLVAGAVVVEEAFGINGIGSLLVSSVSDKDYSVVETISLMLVIVFVVVTTLVDILSTIIDPRLRVRDASR